MQTGEDRKQHHALEKPNQGAPSTNDVMPSHAIGIKRAGSGVVSLVQNKLSGQKSK